MVDQVKPPSLSDLARRTQESLIQRKDETGQYKEPQKLATVAKSVPTVSQTEWFFQAEVAGFSFIFRETRKQVRFDGYYLKTDNRKLAAYIQRSYSTQVVEITKEQYEEGTTLRPGAPEPVRSSIVVNRLPG